MRGVSFKCSPIHTGVSYMYPIWSIALAVISGKKGGCRGVGGWVGGGGGAWRGPGGQDPPPPPPFWGTLKLQKEL